MRTIFFGTPAAAVPSLKALAASSSAPVAVTCQPDRRRGRGRRLLPPPVKAAAHELGLPVLQPESLSRRAFRDELGALAPELLVVVAFGRILGPKLLALAPRGAVNLHFSLLPRWRGAAPVQRAILAGDEETGVSVMQLVQELDAGPVYAQERLAIGADEQAPQLEERLAELGAGLLVATLEALSRGEVEAVPQDGAGCTLAPPLRREEGELDPELPAEELARRVRAFDPWPGAHLALPAGAGLLAVLQARALDERTGEAPGTVLPPRGDALPIACGAGSILLLQKVRPAGRAAMTGASLVHGRLARPGARAARALLQER